MDYAFYACHGMNTLILGEKFAFVGSTYSIPLSSWKNSSGETFDSDGTMSNIPSNVADATQQESLTGFLVFFVVQKKSDKNLRLPENLI